MPLTLTLTEGILPSGQEKVAFRRLGEAMLKWAGLTGNRFMTSAVIGSIHVLPREQTFAAHEENDVAFVEWKVPPIAFTDRKVQVGYIEEATNIIHQLSGGRHPKSRIWVNVTHAVDGTWGINGNAMTSDDLKAAISSS